MNKIYKIVWNKARECYMVVCEYAKSQTKGCSTARLFANRRALKGAMAGVVAVGLTMGVMGVTCAGGTITADRTDNIVQLPSNENVESTIRNVKTNLKYDSNGKVVASGEGSVIENLDIIITNGNYNANILAEGLFSVIRNVGSINVKNFGYLGGYIGVSGENSIVESVGLGGARLSVKGDFLGVRNTYLGGVTAILDGKYSVIESSYLGDRSNIGGPAISNSSNVNFDENTYSSSIRDSYMFGGTINISGKNTSVENTKVSTGSLSVNNSVVKNSTIMGANVDVRNQSTLLGVNANGVQSDTTVNVDGGTVIQTSISRNNPGEDSKLVVNNSSVVFAGYVWSSEMEAIGDHSAIIASTATHILDQSVQYNPYDPGWAMGKVKATGQNSVIIGSTNSSALKDNSTVIGSKYVIADGKNSTIIGSTVTPHVKKEMVYTEYTWDELNKRDDIKNYINEGVKITYDSENERLMGQYGPYNSVVLKNVKLKKVNGVDIYCVGKDEYSIVENYVALGDYSSVVGSEDSYAKGKHATIIGSKDVVTEANYSAILASDPVKIFNGSDFSLIVGSEGVADGDSSTTYIKGKHGLIAGSKDSTIDGNYGMIMGSEGSSVTGNYGVVIGGVGSTAAANAFAFGASTSAIADGVALGSYAKAERKAATVDTENNWTGYNPLNATITDTPTWKSTLSAVSVGDAANGYTRQITGVAAGTSDTDAVNVAQLKALAGAVEKLSFNFKGDTPEDKVLSYNAPDDIAAPGSEPSTPATTGANEFGFSNEISNNNTLNVKGGATSDLTDGNIGVVAKEDADTGEKTLEVKLKKDVALDNGSLTIAEKDSNGDTVQGDVTYLDEEGNTTTAKVDKVIEISADKFNIGGNKITNVSAGEADTDAVNVSQLKAYMSDFESSHQESDRVYAGDVGEVKIAPTGTLSIKGGATEYSNDNNIAVVADKETGTLNLRLAKNISVSSVSTGDTTINNDGMTIKNGPSVTKKGINAGGKKITNVEAGTAPNDVVNVSQLKGLEGRVDNRINKVGARAAALAALHPLDFDPDDKLNFAAGYGHYKGENAGAIGAFYRPDEKVMFSVAGTVAEHDTMINAGVSFSLDRTARQTNSKTAMARDIIDLKAENAEMKVQIQQLINQNNIFMNAIAQITGNQGKPLDVSKIVMFPDVPANHWAYEYIEGLQKLGIIEGYPDGNFSGDRSCTRYEFAAMLFRALKAGQVIPQALANEFKAELGRFRVDRVHGADDSNNKIERIRVNGDHDYGRDNYGSQNPQPVTSRGPQYPEAAKVK